MILKAFIFVSYIYYSHGLYSSSDDVIELNPSTFSQVTQGNDLWLIEFYAPWCGHCKSLAPVWQKAATALKGFVKVAAVNMDEHQQLGGPYNVKGFPTIKIFGQNKLSPSDYNGGRDAESIVNAAMKHLEAMVRSRLNGGSSGGGKQSGGSKVIELTDSNFEKTVLDSEDIWLVEFFAPWCGHCKSLAPHWEQAASELDGKVKLGALDATVHTVMAGRYGIRGYPSIKLFPAGKKSDAVDYEGGRTADDIVRYALDQVTASLPSPEIVEATSADVFTKECQEKPLCIISILPDILDCQSQCRNGHLDVLKKQGEHFKKQGWGWIWSAATFQTQLEQSLGIGGFGYPAMAAVNSRKMIYAILRGPFNEAGIKEFLRALSVGRGATAPIIGGKLPELKKIEPWDGQDGNPPEDEEIDLSELGIGTKSGEL